MSGSSRMLRPQGWLALGLLLMLAAGTGILSEYWLDILSKIMIFAILAISMELVLGTTGLVSFGQAAFFGVGAYTVVLMQQHLGMHNVFASAAGAVGMAALVGALVGSLALRTRNIYFIMVTLAFAQMLYHFAHDTQLVGGSDGIYLEQSLTLGNSDTAGVELAGTVPVYLTSLGLLALCFVSSAAMLRSKFGHALKGIGANEQRMAALGYVPYRYKLAVFTFAAALAGLAGFLYAAKNGAASPEMMAWQQSGVVLLMVLMGGMGYLWGAVCGAVIYVILQEVLSSADLLGRLADHWLLWFGIAIIVIVALWPQGFAGQLERMVSDRK